jgi:SAM-dependent methyltransferase
VGNEDLGLVLTREGWALLQSLPPYDDVDPLALSTRLRQQGFDPRVVAAALTQSRLRARARAKFGQFAAVMVFTSEGLEQATRLSVAARHAQRYAEAGVRKVADLGCGIGGDAMALAGLGLQVLAVDLDETAAACATVNLRQLPGAVVRHADALSVDLRTEGVDGVYSDPARRDRTGRRVFDPHAYSPPLPAVLALREQVPALGVKVAPGIPHRALPPDAHAQWVSVEGAVVEAGLWFGPLAPEGPGRSALLLGPQGGTSLSSSGPPDADPTPAPHGRLEAYLYEPDGAVIRAGLLDQVCDAVAGHLVDPAIAYVTAPRLVPTPLATAYRVVDRLPFGLKRLRAYLRQQEVGRVTIKKRGTAVEPDELRRRLDLRGQHEATLVLTRVGGEQVVLVVEPVS